MYFEVAFHLSATESGIALIPIALTTPGSLLSGQAMMYWKHYKRAPVVGLCCALVALVVLIWRPDLPLAYVILLLAVGTAVGLVYPVTTVSIQNAVPHHQVGIAMGALNFFRSLASAFIVAVLGAILLAGLGVAPERGGRAISVIETVSAAGTDVAFVFRWVFLAAFVFLALSLLFLILMEGAPAARQRDAGRSAVPRRRHDACGVRPSSRARKIGRELQALGTASPSVRLFINARGANRLNARATDQGRRTRKLL